MPPSAATVAPPIHYFCHGYPDSPPPKTFAGGAPPTLSDGLQMWAWHTQPPVDFV